MGPVTNVANVAYLTCLLFQIKCQLDDDDDAAGPLPGPARAHRPGGGGESRVGDVHRPRHQVPGRAHGPVPPPRHVSGVAVPQAGNFGYSPLELKFKTYYLSLF